MRVWPGASHPLGATWDGAGVNFALFSEHATAVELCLFDDRDERVERARIRLEERDDHWEPIEFILPPPPLVERWQVVLDTEQTFPEDGAILDGGSSRRAIGRSLVLLRRVG